MEVQEESKEPVHTRPTATFEEVEAVPRQEQCRAPPPRIGHAYPIENFIDLSWVDKGIFSDSTIKLATYMYPANVQPPKGIIFHFHGFNDRSSRRAYLSKYFADNGYQVVAFDHHGHGNSGGLIGHIHSARRLVDEAELFIDAVIEYFKKEKGWVLGKEGIPMILKGYSMGGGVAFQCAIRKPGRYQLLLLFSPAIREWKDHMFYLKKLSMCLGCLVPILAIAALGHGITCRNPEADDDFQNDPDLYHGRVGQPAGMQSSI